MDQNPGLLVFTKNLKVSESSQNVGVSENSVPLNPMVNDHYPVFKWL